MYINKSFDFYNETIALLICNFSNKVLIIDDTQEIYCLRSLKANPEADLSSPILSSIILDTQQTSTERSKATHQLSVVPLESNLGNTNEFIGVLEQVDEKDSYWDQLFEEDLGFTDEYNNILMTLTAPKRDRESSDDQSVDPFVKKQKVIDAADVKGEEDYFFINSNDLPFDAKELVERLKRDTEQEDNLPCPRVLPAHIADKLKLEDDSLRLGIATTSRLCLRPWSSGHEEKLQQSKRERIQYFDDMGREKMMSMMTMGHSAGPLWRARFEQVVWDYRDIYGTKLLHTSMGFRGFSLVTGDNGRLKQPARRRPGNAFATALSDRMLQMHVNANIIEDGVSEPFGCSSILLKPKCKAADKLTTIEQVEEASDEFLSLNYRFIIDLQDASKSMSPFSSPLPNPRSILAQINSTNYYSALDLLAFFHQCHLSRRSRNLHTFISTGSRRIRQAKRTVMGSNPSLGAGAVITSICWPFLTSYVDNLYLIEKDIQSMYEKFLWTHVVARSVLVR